MLLTKLKTGPEAESKSLSGHFWVIPMTHAKPHPYPQQSSELCCITQHPRWSRFWIGISGFGSLSLSFSHLSPHYFSSHSVMCTKSQNQMRNKICPFLFGSNPSYIHPNRHTSVSDVGIYWKWMGTEAQPAFLSHLCMEFWGMLDAARVTSTLLVEANISNSLRSRFQDAIISPSRSVWELLCCPLNLVKSDRITLALPKRLNLVRTFSWYHSKVPILRTLWKGHKGDRTDNKALNIDGRRKIQTTEFSFVTQHWPRNSWQLNKQISWRLKHEVHIHQI